MITALLLISILLGLLSLASSLYLIARRGNGDAAGVTPRLESLRTAIDRVERGLREEIARAASGSRQEMTVLVTTLGETMRKEISQIGSVQRAQLDSFGDGLARLSDGLNLRLDTTTRSLSEKSEGLREHLQQKHDQLGAEASVNRQKQREEIAGSLRQFNDSLVNTVSQLGAQQRQQIDSFGALVGESVARLTSASEAKLETVRQTIEARLQAIQENNSRELEQMRVTVDEKLQGTLEKRLGESFSLVSERLEQVHRGLGEMQSLATGVGDLKKVLANVKTRGGWGEVQLEALLEEMLSPQQFERNVRTKESSNESVEFAVKFPGRGDDQAVFLPIDAKFPVENYSRLVAAHERNDLEAAEVAGRELERSVRVCARDIRDKYINPPLTTDFAILFLPVEGLYAEVLRRPALAEQIQREFRIVLAGPTTLAAILSSLQMGFRTLAIEKRSGEVWSLLSAVKSEFGKFGEVVARVKKKLDQAANQMDDVAVRSRMIERKLKGVEALPETDASLLLKLTPGQGVVEEAAEPGWVPRVVDDEPACAGE